MIYYSRKMFQKNKEKKKFGGKGYVKKKILRASSTNRLSINLTTSNLKNINYAKRNYYGRDCHGTHKQ